MWLRHACYQTLHFSRHLGCTRQRRTESVDAICSPTSTTSTIASVDHQHQHSTQWRSLPTTQSLHTCKAYDVQDAVRIQHNSRLADTARPNPAALHPVTAHRSMSRQMSSARMPSWPPAAAARLAAAAALPLPAPAAAAAAASPACCCSSQASLAICAFTSCTAGQHNEKR